MKNRKVLSASILLIFIIFFLTSCAKLVKEEHIDIEATIVDTYYHPPYIVPIFTGKVTTHVTRPAIYEVTVEYEGIEYNIRGRSFYEENKDKVGETVKVICHKKYYDDGNITQDIEPIPTES